MNSPVRAFKAVGGTPVFVEKAKGAYLYDEDGNRLIDYISSWGPMILGHAYEPVIEAVKKRADLGTSYGMPTELETQIAHLVVQMVPSPRQGENGQLWDGGLYECRIRLAQRVHRQGKDHQICRMLSRSFRRFFDSSR